MANQRWNEQGRDDERRSTRDDREGRRDRFDESEGSRGTVGRRQFSDDANQGGYAQGQYARERGRHEQSRDDQGRRGGQGGPGAGSAGARREHWMASDDERLRADWESSRGGGFVPRARDLVGGGRSDQRDVSWSSDRGPDRSRGFGGERAYDRDRGLGGERGYDRGERSFGSDRGYDRGERSFGSDRGYDRGERSFGTREDVRPRLEPGRRPGGSPWHGEGDRSFGGYGRSGGDYGRFDNDDQDIRVHGGRFKGRDDDDQRYGMGLQGGAGRGRWVTDPRLDEEEEVDQARARGSWGRQVWAEEDRYASRGGRDQDQERVRQGDEGAPWRTHGRSDRDRDRDAGGGSPVPWRSGNLGARGWSDRDRDVN